MGSQKDEKSKAITDRSDRRLARFRGLLEGTEHDPFSYLGMHRTSDGGLAVSAFHPNALSMRVLDRLTGAVVLELARAHPAGFFAPPLRNLQTGPARNIRQE